MTIQEFMKELDLWREERNLTREGQRQGLLTNVLEELGELGQAIRDDSIEDQIDALLDVSVFLLNSYEIYDIFLKNRFGDRDLSDGKPELIRVVSLGCLNYILAGIYVEEYIVNYISNARAYIHHSGYDFELCLDELMRGLHSRKGKWNESQKKFIKDNTADIYLPDYSKCKRINYDD